MKATLIVVALALLGAIPLQAQAQQAPAPAPAPAPASQEPAPTDDVGNTGSGTGTESLGNTGSGTGTESVGNTGSGTGTESVGNTGSGTGTEAMVMTAAPLVVSLSAQNSWMNSNNSQPITVSAVVGSDDVAVTSGTTTIPLSSSHPACTVPRSVDLAWNSKDGGMATFEVTCARISGKAQTVTITGGSASTSFILKP